jgi:WD40 repeat protein
LASAYGKTVRLWDSRTGKKKPTLQVYPDGLIMCVALNSEGTLLATGGTASTVVLWDMKAKTEKAIFNLKYPPEKPRFAPHPESLAFSRDGKWLASTWGNKIKVWDLATLKEKAVLKGHKQNVLSVVFSSKGTLASASEDSTVRVWDVNTGKEKTVFKGHTRRVRSVAFSSDAKLLASAGDGVVRMWDVTTGRNTATFKQPPPYGSNMRCVVFSGDNKTLAAATNGEVYLWDVATGKLRAILHRHKLPESVAIGGNGNLLAVGSGTDPPNVFLWEIPSTKKAAEADR